MGLDMYLSRRHYVKNWAHHPPEKHFAITVSQGGKPYPVDTGRIAYIETEEIYWRKANAIHRWFVEHVQNGKDDCGRYYVSREQLQELLDACNTILKHAELVEGKIKNGYQIENGKKVPIMENGKYIKNPGIAKEFLPTTSGCFFGSTDYDQYYYDDIKHTVTELTRILANEDDGEFEYRSSW